jgi:hypothetical protein
MGPFWAPEFAVPLMTFPSKRWRSLSASYLSHQQWFMTVLSPMCSHSLVTMKFKYWVAWETSIPSTKILKNKWGSETLWGLLKLYMSHVWTGMEAVHTPALSTQHLKWFIPDNPQNCADGPLNKEEGGRPERSNNVPKERKPVKGWSRIWTQGLWLQI